MLGNIKIQANIQNIVFKNANQMYLLIKVNTTVNTAHPEEIGIKILC